MQAIEQQADGHAEDLRSVLAGYATQVIKALGAITEALNAGGIQTPPGETWHKTSVANLCC